MKKHKAITQGGIIDNQAGLLQDFELITLDESRAVLCTHMLCYVSSPLNASFCFLPVSLQSSDKETELSLQVLDGSIGLGETKLWRQVLPPSLPPSLPPYLSLSLSLSWFL